MQQYRIRILLVDDHPVVLKGLTAALYAEPDMEVVASASDGKAALDLFREKKPDVTVMDLNLTSQMTGIQAIQFIRSEFPDARIIVLSAYKREEDIFRALKAGAATYLLKETLCEELAPVVREVHAGGGPIPPAIGRKLADRVAQPSLSAREVEVLQLVAKGMSNKEIGINLYISQDTVDGHVKSIRSKLNVKDRTEAVTVALRRGILRID